VNVHRVIAGLVIAVIGGAIQAQPHVPKVPGIEVTPLPPSAFPKPAFLPLPVDIKTAEEFVRLGFGPFIPGGQPFQSTEFLTPLLSTGQASQLVRLVPEYCAFKGEAVAAGILRFQGRVMSVQFGREGPPVLYVDLPYWTHQREGPTGKGAGTRISEEEHAKLVAELRSVFVEELGAQEFGADQIRERRIRIWWH